jgi:RND superfamily putative drug exporter
MFHALGALIYRHRWLTLLCAGLFLTLSVVTLLRGARLTSGSVKNLEAERADRLIASVTGHRNETTFVVLFRSRDLDPRSPTFTEAIARALEPLRSNPAVASVESPADADPQTAQGRINPEARSALALVTLHGELEDALPAYPSVREQLRSDLLEISCTGQVPFIHDLNETLERDLMRAELISFPLALLVLLLVFRTGVAAMLPVGVGGLAVFGGIAIVFGLSHAMDIPQFTINVCSLIGLGVAIDYSLFTVSRYREELAAGHDYREALVRAVEHAGQVVAFSSLAVVSGLLGLLFFRGSYLMTMGIGGAIVVALAAIFALTFLPALLAVLGPRIHALRLPLPKARTSAGVWRRIAGWVMKRPLWVLLPTLAFLLALGSPFLRIRLAASDVRVLPPETEAHRGYEQLRAEFPDDGGTHFNVAIEFPTEPVWTRERIGALYDLSERIAAMPGVRKVRSITWGEPRLSREVYQNLLTDPPPQYAPMVNAGKASVSKGRVVFLQAISSEPSESDLARDVVRAIRSDRQIADGTLLVGGESAADLDTTDFLVARAPAAVAFVVTATLIILCVLLGSVLLPLKAVLMNFLSIAGSFGALVFIFQEGHGLIDNPRPLEPSLPVLLFCVLFGLSMDYEVLILTRMKEAYERTRLNTLAVAEGLEKTGGLVTSAAAIMLAVFLAFGLSHVILIKAVGIGMGIAVALDATLVRVLLVPATMRLLGNANWWSPRWLHALRRWLHLELPDGRATHG